jgi:hypothetical protein
MANLKITMRNGESLEIEGRRFSHYVDNIRFWFFLHKTIGGVGLTVTHYESGKRVCEVPHHTVAACWNDTKAAAKMALDELITKAGPARVRSVLARAERSPGEVNR